MDQVYCLDLLGPISMMTVVLSQPSTYRCRKGGTETLINMSEVIPSEVEKLESHAGTRLQGPHS